MCVCVCVRARATYHPAEGLGGPLHGGDVAELRGAQLLVGGQHRHPLQSAGEVEPLVDLEPLGLDAARKHLLVCSQREEVQSAACVRHARTHTHAHTHARTRTRTDTDTHTHTAVFKMLRTLTKGGSDFDANTKSTGLPSLILKPLTISQDGVFTISVLIGYSRVHTLRDVFISVSFLISIIGFCFLL